MNDMCQILMVTPAPGPSGANPTAGGPQLSNSSRPFLYVFILPLIYFALLVA